MSKEKENINEEELNNTPQEEATDTPVSEASASDTNATEPEEEKDPLDVALERIKELETQALYRQAEFENFRKRTITEKADLILNGAQKTVLAILPVLDDMERAIASAASTEDIKALEEGWELIAKKLMKTLEGLGVQKMDTTEADFNTDFHEAIAMVPGMGDDKKGKVIDCVQAGYTLNDKVIRHAKVAVGQ